MTSAAASMDLSENIKPARQVIDGAMTSVCYLYDADFRTLKELCKADTGEKLMEAV